MSSYASRMALSANELAAVNEPISDVSVEAAAAERLATSASLVDIAFSCCFIGFCNACDVPNQITRVAWNEGRQTRFSHIHMHLLVAGAPKSSVRDRPRLPAALLRCIR